MLQSFYIVLYNMLKNYIDCNDTEIWKILAYSADFLFGEDLEAILSLTESDSFDE